MRFKAVGLSLLFVLILMFAATSPTKGDQQSDPRNTEHLLRWCKEPETSFDHAYCAGYVSGMADVMGLIGVGATKDFKLHFGMCTSEPYPSANAEVQAFINWAEKHPTEWGTSAQVSVLLALQETWPCLAK